MMLAGKYRKHFAFLLAVHLLLGFYAVYDDGYFIYGFTSLERFLYHTITGGESHITLSGAQKHVSDDLCLQSCSDCRMDCYFKDKLAVKCDQGCSLVTDKGTVLVEEGDSLTHILKKGLLLSDVVFKCYDFGCGFETPLLGNMTYLTHLPDEVKALR